MLQGKKILLGVSGSIAAYKAAECASALTKLGADVHVLMTKNAAEFITPLTFETLTKHRAAMDTFDRNFEYKVGHISLATDIGHCSCVGRRYRKACKRHRRRYAYDYGPCLHLPENSGAGNEFPYV